MDSVSNSFPSIEHLKHKRKFDELFSSGKRDFKHPIMVLWKETEVQNSTPLQAGFSVPKKHFKKAIERNRIKRRLREAYRTQKAPLFDRLKSSGRQLTLLFVIVKPDNISYEELQPKILLLLQGIEDAVFHAE